MAAFGKMMSDSRSKKLTVVSGSTPPSQPTQTSESCMDEKFMQEFERRGRAQKADTTDPLKS